MDGVIVRSDRPGPLGLTNANMFIPISLGNHYYSSEILRRLLSDFVANSKFAVVFLCDRLRLLSYRIRGEADIQRIDENIKLQLDQWTRSLINLGLGSYPNSIVASWSFLLDDPRYSELLASLENFLREDATLHRQLEVYAAELVDRFRGLEGADIQERIVLQRQYVIEETALSLYMTELRGFNVEVYRRGMGFIDSIYRERRAEIMSLLGKSKLDRRFVSLEEWITSKSCH
jgi:tRNA-dependent cyclodipeptide synthase